MELMADLVCNFIRQRAETDAGQGHAFSDVYKRQPWHGCVKCSEGCQNCYMYFLDRMRDQNGAEIYKTKSGFSYPLQKDRTGHYKIRCV